ncbi:MAG: DNA polymerase III subunit beta [Candidatus Harrisonbacteria bacterium]|nr:DNA polymerase III subunit beta [Candidatus Harrisonbacteria bacterium]
MKIIVLKNNLKEALSVIEHGVGDNNALPILKNVLIQTENEKIVLRTTNLELAIKKTLSGKIIEPGAITVPLSVLYSIISNLSDEKVSLDTKDTTLLISTEKYQAKIQGVKDDEFPVIPKIETESVLIIASQVLKKAISKVFYAAELSEIRPEIGGVLFDFLTSNLKLVATDSFRLAEMIVKKELFSFSGTSGFKAIIPLKTVQEIIRIFPEDEMIKISFDPTQVFLQSSSIELISRLLEGEYPDYEQIIPKTFITEVILKKEDLGNAVKVVSTFSGKNNDVNLSYSDAGDMSLYSLNQVIGENKYSFSVSGKGESFENIAYNWRFIQDGLRALEGPTIFFGVNGSDRPSLIKSTESDIFFSYIVMPIKK